MFKKKKFEDKLGDLFRSIIELGFEYVDNSREINVIYVYCSNEIETYYVDFLYDINGSIYDISEVPLDIDKSFDMQGNLGEMASKELILIKDLFKKEKREVPTEIKLTYKPKTNFFDSKISYDLKWSNTEDLMNTDLFDKWRESLTNYNS